MKNLLAETLKKCGASSVENLAQEISWAKIRREHITEWLASDRYEEEDPEIEEFILHPSHTLEEAISFLKSLDFEYDDGYGSQEVHGIIMLNSNKWLEREEYDGSEWWVKRTIPRFE